MAKKISVLFKPAEGQSINKIFEDSVNLDETILHLKKRIAPSLQSKFVLTKYL